jgi:hypothetical protein
MMHLGAGETMLEVVAIATSHLLVLLVLDPFPFEAPSRPRIDLSRIFINRGMQSSPAADKRWEDI